MNGDGEKDCDPEHTFSIVKHLPEVESVPCQLCSKGMSKDEGGDCRHCPMGLYQPNDLDDSVTGSDGTVVCTDCEKGTFAEMTLDIKQFDKMPSWL